MKLSNAVMFDSIQALSAVNEKGKLGYACARNLRRLLDACREYMEVRDKFMMEYGTSQGDGRYTFEQDKAQAFAEAIREYAAIEHEVDVFQVDEDTFCSGTLTAKEMYALDWMVKEGE